LSPLWVRHLLASYVPPVWAMFVGLEDFCFALRLLVKRPGFSAIAVLMLALGIGANTAIFSLANALFLRPIPYPEAGRLVEILEIGPNGWPMPVDYPNFAAWRDEARSIESAAAFQNTALNLTGVEQPEEVAAANVSASFFPTLGVKPWLGRAFLQEEDRPGAPLAVILSHSLWQTRFGADPTILGKTLQLNGRAHAVAGVLPSGFRFYRPADLYIPIEAGAEAILFRRGARDRTLVIARSRPDTPRQKVRAELETIYRRLDAESPDVNRGVRALITPLRDRVAGNAGKPVLVLLGAVALLLLIACVNVANLMLARSAERSNEMAVRAALGAGRFHMLRQLLTEGLLLSLSGALAGVLLASWSLDGLEKFLPATVNFTGLAMDARVLGFTLVVSVVTALLFGLGPALLASQPDPMASLREGGRTSTAGRTRHRLGRALVSVEVGLAIILLAGAGLLIRSFVRLTRVDPGVQVGNILTMRLNLPHEKYGKQPQFVSFCERVLDRVRGLPGVQEAGFTTSLPLSGSSQRSSLLISGRPAPPATSQLPAATWHAVSSGYLSAMRIPLRRGRYLEDSDRDPSNAVAVISESMARRFWPGEDPIGRQIHQGPLSVPAPWMTVVGIVGDTRHYGLNTSPEPEYYFLAFQLGPWSAPTLVIRTEPNPMSLAPAVRRAITAVDKDQPAVAVRTMREYLDGSVASRRTNAILLGFFAAAALALAAVGVYGVISNSVAGRRQEIGVRMALGANRQDVLRLVVGDAAIPVLVGTGAGLLTAMALTRLLAGMLYGVTPRDPAILGGVTLLLALVALLASYIPARRAAGASPVEALRFQ
jgi:putative ABC transport system permease protein